MNLENREEIRDFIFNIIEQGDNRYNDAESEKILSNFIIKKAVFFEEKEIPFIEMPEKLPKEVQATAKYIAEFLLKKEGFEKSNLVHEVAFEGSRPDIYAESSKKSIAVECYSCKVHKIIDFLSKTDEVWVITRGLPPWEKIKYLKEDMKLFVFKKGPDWDKVFNKYKNIIEKELKKVKSPIDVLIEEKKEK